MRKEILSVGLMTVLFAGVAVVGFRLRPVLGAADYITIKADGSVVPADSPVRSFDNVTYVLTQHLNVGPDESYYYSTRGIVIERSNVIVDGHGHILNMFSTVTLSGTTNVTVRNFIITYINFGILLESASNNTICENVVENGMDASWGIILRNSSNNNILRNRIYDNIADAGILLEEFSNNNTITGNQAQGIHLINSGNNTITDNDILSPTSNWVFEVRYSSDNIICHNNIDNGGYGLEVVESTNRWDNDYPSGGNYWSDYNGTDTDSDGKGDAPYVIKESNIDRFPLMQPWVVPNITPPRLEGYITIEADGGIDPPGAPIMTFDNLTYTFTDNITSVNDGIAIERSNITIDGNGYALKGNRAIDGMGVHWSGLDNITLRYTIIKSFFYGIRAVSTLHNSILENNLTANIYCIELSSSSDNIVSGNIMEHSENSGIRLYSSSNNILTGNNIGNNGYGIILSDSSINTISGNNVTNSGGYGFWLSSSHSNILSRNNVTETGQTGIYLQTSDKNTLSENNVANTHYGIFLSASSGNTMSSNNVTETATAIVLYTSSQNNVFYHNSLVRSNRATYLTADSVNNVWDSGYPSGGNYWSDFTGTDANHNGIGDTPYIIDTNNTDHYPLMTQYNIPEFPLFLVLPLIFTATLLAAIINSRLKLTRKPVRGK